MRVIFAGTPEFAAVSLRGLLAARHEIALVLTQPDRPSGRQMRPTPSAVKRLALDHGLKVFQPERLACDDVERALAQFNGEVVVVAAYGLIFPATLLNITPFGSLNVHASLLPRWRGAAPIPRAILAGDNQTGITIMKMEPGLDTGPILLQKIIEIAANDTTLSLTNKLALLGAESIVETLNILPQGGLVEIAQSASAASYAAKIDKAESAINWHDSATQITRAIRAYNPAPGAHSEIRGQVIKLWHGVISDGASGSPGTILDITDDGIAVACGQGVVLIKELQKPGAQRMQAKEFSRGFRIETGARFVSDAASGTL